jgi:hypothetical protein
MLAKLGDGARGVGVGTIADDVTLVGAADGLENFGMHASVIVAGETAGGFHDRTNLADHDSHITVPNLACIGRQTGMLDLPNQGKVLGI